MGKQNQNIPPVWIKTIFSIILVFILSFVIYYQSWISIIEIWARSKTFNHCFFIIPISIWLILKKKEYYSTLKPEVNLKLIILVFLNGILWLLADLINVQVIQQLATVGVLVSGVVVVLGLHVTSKMLFPIGFLFLMVPMGEELIPYLMEFTATFTVKLIRLTGISIYREGLQFSLTSGNWSVIEACSGINYLIASFTLGLVYAYLNYHFFWKRCLFILLSIIVPIIANGFRAFLIVMTGHFSGMTVAVGVDHIVYGAVFFGFVIFVLFYIGSFWKDPEANYINKLPQFSIGDKELTSTFYKQYISLLLTIGLSFSLWPSLSYLLIQQQRQNDYVSHNFTNIEKQGWLKAETFDWKWKANFKDVLHDSIHYFSKRESNIAIYTASFGEKTYGQGELINSQNLLVRYSDAWKVFKNKETEINFLDGSKLEVKETILRGNTNDLLVFYWYQIGQYKTSNTYFAKYYQLIKRLFTDESPEYIVVTIIETPQNRYKVKREQLLNFIGQWWKK